MEEFHVCSARHPIMEQGEGRLKHPSFKDVADWNVTKAVAVSTKLKAGKHGVIRTMCRSMIERAILRGSRRHLPLRPKQRVYGRWRPAEFVFIRLAHARLRSYHKESAVPAVRTCISDLRASPMCSKMSFSGSSGFDPRRKHL